MYVCDGFWTPEGKRVLVIFFKDEYFAKTQWGG